MLRRPRAIECREAGLAAPCRGTLRAVSGAGDSRGAAAPVPPPACALLAPQLPLATPRSGYFCAV